MVSTGTGYVFAQNMMYRHTITVYDSKTLKLVKTIPDSHRRRPSSASRATTGSVQGAPVEAAETPDHRFMYVSQYYDQVVLRDTCIGAPAGCTPSTILISANIAGAAPSDDSYHPSISADGRYVTFESYATDIVSGVTSNKHIYLRDTCIGATGPCTPTTTLVDVGTNGEPGNDYSYTPSTNATGRFITFESYADNLVPDDTNGEQDVFVRDTCIG